MDNDRNISGSRELYKLLRENIRTGKMQDGERIPSIRDLAEEFALNKSTVNTVISMLSNEGLIRIEKGRGAYVCRAADDMRAKPIGVLLLNFDNPAELDIEILSAIQKNITSNYYLLPVSASRHYDDFLVNLERVIDLGAVGIMILPPDNPPQNDAQVKRAQRLLSRQPVVYINREIPGFTTDLYSMDLRLGIQKALDYFAIRGRNRVALIQHNTELFLHDEMEGWREGCERLGIPAENQFIIPYPDDTEALRRQLVDVLPHINALVGPDKFIQMMQDVICKDRSIPHDLSIVGINDTIITRMFQPQMTGLAYPVERICRHATQKLMARIENKETGKFARRYFVPELILRGT